MPKNSKLAPTLDGGYYAIKGFAYQFDKSLIEALDNPNHDVEIEQIQDIVVSSYYIQVKHKESQTFTQAKIRKPVTQLLKDFLKNKNSSYILYCHFKDQKPDKKSLTMVELDEILSTEKDKVKVRDKKEFLKKFTLQFSTDFASQFKELVKKVKEKFELRTDEESILYLAIFRAQILEKAIKKEPKQRKICFDKLKEMKDHSENLIFELAHCNYLGKKKYLTYLKKEYFTLKKVNLSSKERLFVIEIDDQSKDSDILQVITNIKNKYFKQHTSPAPYICFYGTFNNKITTHLKQRLWDKKLFFADGTHFNGDKFRIVDFIADLHTGFVKECFKLVEFSNMPLLLKRVAIQDIFLFKKSQHLNIRPASSELKAFYIDGVKDIIKIIE